MIEFVAPLSLEACETRLQQTEKRPSIVSFIWKSYTQIDSEWVDDDHIQVQLKRLEDPSLINWGSLATLEAQLARIDANMTRVNAVVKLNWAQIMIYEIMLVALVSFFVLGMITTNIFSSIQMLFLGGTGVLLFILSFIFLVISAYGQTAKLIDALKEKLLA